MSNMPKKLEVARIRVSFMEPFFGSVMYSIPCEAFSEAMEAGMKVANMMPTMATDGRVLYYSKEWVEQRTVNELIGVLIHEIWHICLKHHLRCDKLMTIKNIKDGSLQKLAAHQRWNKAADYVINPMVLEDGHTLPAGGLVDVKYRNLSTEQVYNLLNEEQQKKGAGRSSGGSGDKEGQEWGQVISLGDLSEDQVRELEQEIETKVRQAAMNAKTRGKVPAGVEKLINDWDEAKVDWRSRLWRACDSYGGVHEEDWWERPNRRYVQHGIFMPSTVEYGPGTVAVFADSSGSVSDEEFKAAMSEVAAIVNDCKPERTIFCECDAEIPPGQPIEFASGEDFPDKYTRRRGGGTDFNPPFRWLKKNNIRPQWCIYLTDGYAPWPKEPDFPVIWVITSDVVAPWGTTIHLKV